MRRKLWEISPSYHCAVIGSCLSLAELRRLARQAGIAEWASASDYELHHAAVNLTCRRNELSRLVQKALDRKFAVVLKTFSQASTDAAVRQRWKESLGRGDVAGAFWAVMTHPEASETTLECASRELHMLSHQIGASSRADLRRLAALEEENRSLRERLAEQRCAATQELAAKEARIDTLERRLADAAGMESRLREAEERLRLVDEPPLRRSERDPDADTRLARSEERCAELEQACAELRLECEAAERALQRALDEGASGEAPIVDLAGRRVLYVGGRTGLVDRYRRLVERHGGELLHHDGGVEESVKRLPALLAAADVVVCATGEASHAAYYLAKRFCKHAGKPCALLRKASLGSLCAALRAFAEESAPGHPRGTVLLPAA